VQITSGLNVGDRVIASGREKMQEGLRIEVRSEASDGAALPPSNGQTEPAPKRLQ
jgi:hypothetical protein